MGVLSAWMVAIGAQTIRDVKRDRKPPKPSEFLASGAFFGTLALVSGASPEMSRLAGVVAWGVLIALVLKAGGPSALTSPAGPSSAGQPKPKGA